MRNIASGIILYSFVKSSRIFFSVCQLRHDQQRNGILEAVTLETLFRLKLCVT